MDREEFMGIVYDELHSDGDNNRANRIINAADEYAESTRLIPHTEVISEEAYQRGLDDAWEAAKKIVSIPTAELHTMLDKAVYYDTVFRYCTASECIEKIRAHEEKKKAEQEMNVELDMYIALRNLDEELDRLAEKYGAEYLAERLLEHPSNLADIQMAKAELKAATYSEDLKDLRAELTDLRKELMDLRKVLAAQEDDLK